MTEQDRPDSWWPRDPDREPDQAAPGAAPGATPAPPAPASAAPDASDPTQPGWAQSSSPAHSGQWVPDYGQGTTTPSPSGPAGVWGPPAGQPPGGAPGEPTWPPGAYGAGGWMRPQNEPLAVAGLVVGIFSLLCGVAGCLGIVVGPVAIGLSVAARRKIAASGGLLGGSGMATTGLVCGIVGLIVSIGWLVFLLANPDFVQELQNQLTTTTTTR